MSIRIPLRVLFNKRKTLNKQGMAPVIIEAYFSRKVRKPVKLNILIEPKYWNEKQLKVVKHTNAIFYNSIILSTMSNIEEYQSELIRKGKSLTPDLLDQFLDNHKHQGSAISIMRNALNEQVELSINTYKSINTFINLFEEFRPEITFAEINYDLIITFDRYLRARGGAQSYIHKNHRILGKFIKVAVKKNLFNAADNPYLHFAPKAGESKKEALSMDELNKLERLVIPENQKTLRIALDLFLFCCYSGLRYSDMQGLSSNEVSKDLQGNYHINFEMEKVERANYLPISELFNGRATRILEKYLNLGDVNKIFPSISNRTLNRNLKTLGALIGSKVKFTTHLGRHTFGSLLADITGNPIIIKTLMGHKSVETSMIYIHMSNKRLIKQLKKQDWSGF